MQIFKALWFYNFEIGKDFLEITFLSATIWKISQAFLKNMRMIRT